MNNESIKKDLTELMISRGLFLETHEMEKLTEKTVGLLAELGYQDILRTSLDEYLTDRPKELTWDDMEPGVYIMKDVSEVKQKYRNKVVRVTKVHRVKGIEEANCCIITINGDNCNFYFPGQLRKPNGEWFVALISTQNGARIGITQEPSHEEPIFAWYADSVLANEKAVSVAKATDTPLFDNDKDEPQI